MPKKKNNINFAHAFLGNLLFALFLWLNLSLIAKTMSPSALGQYSLALSILSPVFGLFNLHLRSVYVTGRGNISSDQIFLKTRTIFSLAAIIVSVMFLFFINEGRSFLIVFCCLSVAKYFDSLSDMRYAFFQKNDDMFSIAKSQILRGIFGFVGIVIGVALCRDLALASFLYAVAWGVLYYFHDRRRSSVYVSVSNEKITVCDIKALFYISFPLGFLILINLLNINLPRYFVSHIMGIELLGYFVAVTYFIFLGAMFVNALGQVILKRLSDYYFTDRTLYLVTLGKSVLFAVGIGIIAISFVYLFGGDILELAYTEDYRKYSSELVLAMFVSIPIYISSMLGTALTSTRKFGKQALINIPIPIIIIIYFFLLQDKLNLKLAIISLLVAYLVKIIMQVVTIIFLLKNNN